MNRPERFGSLVVTLGTFSIPIAQWVIFWLLGRVDGVESAGSFAFLLAISTPVFTLTNLGLRNGYITMDGRYPFGAFVFLRVMGSVFGALLVTLISLSVGLRVWLVIAVVCQKVADGFLDILYARFQRARRLLSFGSVMIVNGIATVALATLLSLTTASGDFIVASTAVGSCIALVFGLVVVSRSESFRVQASELLLVPRKSALIAVVRRCWPIGGSQVLAALALNVPTWVVAAGGSAVETGRFAGAAYLLTASWLIGSALGSTHIGEYRVRVLEGGPNSVVRVAVRDSALITAFALLFVIPIITAGGSVLVWLYGEGFGLSSGELALVGVAAALSPGAYLLNAALLALNRYRQQMVVLIWALLACVPFIVGGFVAPALGAVLACTAALVGSALRLLLSAHQLRNTGRVPER